MIITPLPVFSREGVGGRASTLQAPQITPLPVPYRRYAVSKIRREGDGGRANAVHLTISGIVEHTSCGKIVITRLDRVIQENLIKVDLKG
jgi:hypothetical protein